MAKNLVLWLVIAAVLFSVFQSFGGHDTKDDLSYSQFVQEVQADKVSQVAVDGLMIRGIRSDSSTFSVVRPEIYDIALMDDLLKHNVVVKGTEPRRASLWEQLLVASFPILLFIGVFVFFMRQMQGGAGGRGGPKKRKKRRE